MNICWLIRRSRTSSQFPNVLTFHFQTTLILEPQSLSPILKTAVSCVVTTGKQWGWSLTSRALGSMGTSVSAASTEKTKCPSREQAAGKRVHINSPGLFPNMVLWTSTDLTIKSVEALRIMHIIAAAQFDALMAVNARPAAGHPKRSFYITFPR